MKRAAGTAGGFVLVVMLACLVSGFFSLFIGLTFGGVGAAVSPDFHFGLVEGFVCPEGMALEWRQVRYSYHEPGESTIEASCVGQDGTELPGQELKVIGAVMGLYFAVSFAVLFLLGLLFGGVLVSLFNRLMRRNNL